MGDLESLYRATYKGFRDDPYFENNLRELFARHIVGRLPERGAVLDVGCGNGTALSICKEAGFQARGIDVSEDAVSACRARGLEADVDDFAKTAIGPASFDLVTFWDVLEHLLEPRSFIASAARVLRPNGWLLVKVPHHRWISLHVSAAIPRLARSVLNTPAHLQFFTRRSLRQLLREHFYQPEWVHVGPLRSVLSQGTAKQKLVRGVVKTIRAVSQDGTLLAIAKRRP